MSTVSCAGDSGIEAVGTPITDVAFSPDGKLFAVTVNSKTAVMCSSDKETHRFFTLPDVGRKAAAITAVAINQDATALAIGSSSGRAYVFDSSNAATPHLVSALNPSGLISSIAFSASGDRLALASSDGFTFLFNLTSLRRLGAPIADPGRSRGINSVTFSPDGKLLAAADGNGSTYLSSISTGKLLSILPDPASRGVAAVAFSPDGSQLATADLSGVTYLWPLSSQSKHPAPPKSASSPSAIVEATAINTLLMSSVQTRSQFDSDTLINDVASCLNVDSAVTQIGDIAAGRASELTQAMDLKVDSIPDGALLKSKLIAALGVSLKIDKGYLAWAKQQASTGCAEGTNSVLYQLAVQLDEQATNVKTEFLNLWNPEAAQFGLVQFSREQI
jgi:WD40 repeat protein